MKELRISLIALSLSVLFTTAAGAQCETWNGKPFEEEATNAHVLYRGVVKGKTVAELQMPPSSKILFIRRKNHIPRDGPAQLSGSLQRFAKADRLR